MTSTPRRNDSSAPLKRDFRDRARDLIPLLQGASSRIEEAGRIPGDILSALHDAELFRMLLPKSVGGGEVDLPTFVETVEIIGRADASVAWCLSQAGGCATAAAYLNPKVAQEIFADRDATLCWGPPAIVGGKTAQARIERNGYRLTGEWQFASGCHNTTWFGGPIFLVLQENGGPVTPKEGKPAPARVLLFPKNAATVIPVWDVMGLRGTGSDSYKVHDLFVPADFSFEVDEPSNRIEKGPLYLFPTLSIYGYAFAGVAVGIARGMLDAFINLASEKTPLLLGSKLRENSIVQTDIAKAEARLRAARAYLMQTLHDVWDAVVTTGALTLDQRVSLRLMVTHTIHEAKEVVDVIYGYAGTTAIFTNNPFERRFRDIHTLTQHIQARFSNYETVGQIVLGLPPRPFL